MTEYIDTYLKSKDKASLETLQGSVINMIQPVQGRASSQNEDGSWNPAFGDPEYWYTCVRAVFPVPAFDGVELCDEAEGVAVCGVWA